MNHGPSFRALEAELYGADVASARAELRALGPRLKRVGRVRELAVELGQRNGCLPLKERCTEALALADEASANPALNPKRARLESEMSAVEELIRRRFLGQKDQRS